MKKRLATIIAAFVLFTVCSATVHATVEMVLIPGGEFEMGDHFNEGYSWELPVHPVYVDSFYMGKYEVTNQQYCDYLNSALSQGLIEVRSGVVYAAGGGTDPYCDMHSYNPVSQIDYVGGVFSVRTKSDRNMSNDPMVHVSWYGTFAYCNWRSQQEGYEVCYDLSTWECNFTKQGYRLPTEAEWEYAARGGEYSPYYRFPWGDTISHSQANYNSSGSPSYDESPTSGYHPAYNDGIWPYTSPVGSFQANGYGLYDTAGNVWEYCNDWYDAAYYSEMPYPHMNPTGPPSGSTRVIRSGSWHTYADSCRVARRSSDPPDGRGYDRGFRVVSVSEPACWGCTLCTWELHGPESDMVIGVHGFGAAALDGYLYAVGGQSSTSSYGTSHVQKYDPETDKWVQVASLQQQRHSLDCAVVDGYIYAIAGHVYNSMSTNERYDPSTNTWTFMTPKPTPVSGLGIAVFNGKIYTFGGNRYGSNQSVIEVYDPGTNSWQNVGNMPAPGQPWRAATLGCKIYLAGGDLGGIYDLLWCYDPATGIWDTDLPRLNCPRQGHELVVIGDCLFAIGGSNSSCVEWWKPGELSWTLAESLNVPRGHLGAETIDDMIYVFGGGNEFGTLSSVESTAVNIEPVADANGPYIEPATIWDGALVELDGTGSSDADGDTLIYEWDLDRAVDSDGDGDPNNDVDATGAMPEAVFPIGQTEISLVVVDECEARSEADVTTVTVTLIEVGVEIRSDDGMDTINLESSGVVRITFLTGPGFDATTVDPLTVTLRGMDFATGLVKFRGKNQSVPMVVDQDFDGDGDVDRVVNLDTERLAEYELDAYCEVGALTYDGLVVLGVDTAHLAPVSDGSE